MSMRFWGRWGSSEEPNDREPNNREPITRRNRRASHVPAVPPISAKTYFFAASYILPALSQFTALQNAVM
jgi:hypothetical protein